MKKILVTLIVITLIILLPIYGKESSKEDHKKVLIIHSYHKGLSWTDEFQQGIEDTLMQENVELMTEYMDCYRFYYDGHFDVLFNYYKDKYSDENIDVVVVVDNFAYELMKEYNGDFLNDVPVVFGGINNFSKTDLIKDNSTGIAQNSSQKEMIDLILQLHPETKTILISGASSATAIADATSIITVGEQEFADIQFESILTNTFEEQVDRIKKYSNNSVVIATGTIKDEKGNFLEHSIFSKKLIEETGLPVYAMAKSYIDDGAIGGLAIDSYVHGQMVADYVNELLNGKSISILPIIEKPVVGYMFDYNRLKQFNINENQLPEDSIILNEPSSLLTIDKKHITLVYSVIVLMTLLIIVFIILNIKDKRAKKIIMETKVRLRENNLELETNNKFLIESKEKLKKQYQELTEKNAHIEFLAFYDTVTHLMKRDKLIDTLTQLFISNPEISICVFDADISNLKMINDTYGHEVGNKVLEYIAQFLSDHHQGIHYLLGTHHSEFIIVYLAYLNEEEALIKAQNLIKTAMSPLKIENKEIDLQINIGIAMYPEHGSKPSYLLKNANIAMMEAIKTGLNMACVYKEKFYDDIMNRLDLEKKLKKALLLQEFELFYQPKIATKTCRILGYEALIRWHHPDGRIVFPGKFIAIAEETGLINSIGNWVIMEACKQIKEWEAQGLEYVVAVNVSARQLAGTDLYNVVKSAIETYNIRPQHLELEITETVMIQDIERNAKLFDRLRALNIGIALDDFGTGYSSMSYIKALPITKLKIDKSFIDNIEEKAQKEIIKSIISLGQALNFIINIEGVEREEQFNILKEYKADEVQGFLFSKALPINELPSFISSFEDQFKHMYSG